MTRSLNKYKHCTIQGEAVTIFNSAKYMKYKIIDILVCIVSAQFSWTFITIIDFPVVWKDLSLKNDHAKSCALPAHFIQKLNIFNVDSTGFSIDKILISFKSSYIDQLQTSNLSSLIPLSRDGAFYVSHTFPDITHILQYMYFFHGYTK